MKLHLLAPSGLLWNLMSTFISQCPVAMTNKAESPRKMKLTSPCKGYNIYLVENETNTFP